MSTLENTRLEEDLAEKFDIAISEDYDLQNALAYATLEPGEHYRYCKEGGRDLVDWDEVYERILQAFYDYEGSCTDIRTLAEEAYEIEIK